MLIMLNAFEPSCCFARFHCVVVKFGDIYTVLVGCIFPCWSMVYFLAIRVPSASLLTNVKYTSLLVGSFIWSKFPLLYVMGSGRMFVVSIMA